MLSGNLVIDPLELPKTEEIPHTGHPDSFRKELIVLSSIPFVILLAGPVVLLILDLPVRALAAALLLVVLYSLVFFLIRKSFPVRAYALRELDISYKKGWLFFSHVTVPFNRVQHSEISQGPIDRYFGLVTLHIYTAGGSSSDLSIPGLPREEAERLRDFISRYHD